MHSSPHQRIAGPDGDPAMRVMGVQSQSHVKPEALNSRETPMRLSAHAGSVHKVLADSPRTSHQTCSASLDMRL